MNQFNKVVQIRHKPLSFLQPLQDAFSFRSDRKYHRVQKACLWLLKKIGAHHMETRVEYQRVVLDSDRFIKNLFAQYENIQSEFNHAPSMLLIGSKDYHDLMGDKDVMSLLSFPVEYRINREDDYGRIQIGRHRLEVRVIPWMEGTVIF